jgi:hypothetical protein
VTGVQTCALPIFMPKEYTIPALVEAMVEYYKGKS